MLEYTTRIIVTWRRCTSHHHHVIISECCHAMDAVPAVVADHVAAVNAARRAAHNEARRDGAGDEAVLDDRSRRDIDVKRLNRTSRQLEGKCARRVVTV